MSAESTAGSIVGFLRLDIADFEAGIAKAQALADHLDGKNVDVQVKADTAGAEAKLAAVSVSEDRVSKSSGGAAGGLNSVVAATRRLADASGVANVAQLRLGELQNSGKAPASQIAKATNDVERAQRTLADATWGTYASNIKLDDSNKKVGQSARLATTGVGGLSKGLDGIPGGSPLLIGGIAAAVMLLGPAAGAATAATAGLGGALGVTLLAYRGFESEIAHGTTLGIQMQSGLHGIVAELDSMGRVAAVSAGPGVLSAFAQIHAAIPSLTSLVSGLGGDLGQAFSITAGGLISALHTLEPLMRDAGGYAKTAATAFARFAASGEFKQFVEYSRQELPKVIDLAEQLTGSVVDLGVAAAPTGDSLIGLATSLTTILGPATAVFAKISAFQNNDIVKSLALGPLGFFGPIVSGINTLRGASGQATPPVAALTAVTSVQALAQQTLAGKLGMTTAALAVAQAAQKTTAASAQAAADKMRVEGDAAGILKMQLDLLNGKAISAAQAQNALDSSLVNMGNHTTASGKKVTWTTTSIKDMSSASVALRGELLGQVTNMENVIEANGGLSHSTAGSRAEYEKMRRQIIDNAVSHGVNRKAVAAFIDTVLKTPTGRNTDFTDNSPQAKARADALKVAADAAARNRLLFINVNNQGALGPISAVQRAEDALRDKTVQLKYYVTASGAAPSGGSVIPGIVKHPAAGGLMSGPGTGTSDSIPAMVSNGEYVLRASAVKSVGVGALNQLNKFAAGGPVGAAHFASGGFVAADFSAMTASMVSGNVPSRANIVALTLARAKATTALHVAENNLYTLRHTKGHTAAQISLDEERLANARGSVAAATLKLGGAEAARAIVAKPFATQFHVAAGAANRGTAAFLRNIDILNRRGFHNLADQLVMAGDIEAYTLAAGAVKSTGTARALTGDVNASVKNQASLAAHRAAVDARYAVAPRAPSWRLPQMVAPSYGARPTPGRVQSIVVKIGDKELTSIISATVDGHTQQLLNGLVYGGST